MLPLMVLYAKDILEKEFISLPRRATVLDAAKVMRDRHHGFAIVVSGEGSPEGIVTEWDVLAHVVAEARNPAEVYLEEIMSRSLVSVDVAVGIGQVAQTMSQRGTRRVLVTKDGKIVGIIQARTILAHMKEYIDRLSAQIARTQPPMF